MKPGSSSSPCECRRTSATASSASPRCTASRSARSSARSRAPETPFASLAREAYLDRLRAAGGRDLDLIDAVNEDYKRTIEAGRLIGRLAAEGASQAQPPPAAGAIIAAASLSRGRIAAIAMTQTGVAEREIARGREAFANAMGARRPSLEYERGRAAFAKFFDRAARGAVPATMPGADALAKGEAAHGAAAFAAALGKTGQTGGRQAPPAQIEVERGRAAFARARGKSQRVHHEYT